MGLIAISAMLAKTAVTAAKLGATSAITSGVRHKVENKLSGIFDGGKNPFSTNSAKSSEPTCSCNMQQLSQPEYSTRTKGSGTCAGPYYDSDGHNAYTQPMNCSYSNAERSIDTASPQLGAVNPADQQQLSYKEKIERIKQLKELLDCGILTETEFNSKKTELLNL